MRKYCKAYHLEDLRRYPRWQEHPVDTNTSALTDETIVYLWDDFTVVESPVLQQGNLFDTVTPEWKTFCTETLNFAIPEDLQYAYQVE
ncbi:hypothetical protein [Dictyobacter arantiisoli]|uniref:Uncharacterized protein n=1 Tax=Dictyobacter arantiisoli TaxID=2014874 RepID=A0A5A5TE47_9CHLR|nr:hypothetical protein [Dictyobacter arantiisoli]GCF09831.1 hypothetical protein KDI_33950 [Dictyobacter arantiisoli]